MEQKGTHEDPFVAHVTEEDGRPVVVARGEIDVATSETFGRCVAEALERDPKLVLDLAEVTFMDSTGLSVIVRAYQSSGQVREGIVVRSPCSAVRRTLEVSGIAQLITIDG